MSKRVFELAKEIDLPAKELLTKAQNIGIELTNHFSTLSDDQIQQIRDLVSGKAKKETTVAKKLTGVRRVRKKVDATPEEPPAEKIKLVKKKPVEEAPEKPAEPTPKLVKKVEKPAQVEKVQEPEKAEPVQVDDQKPKPVVKKQEFIVAKKVKETEAPKPVVEKQETAPETEQAQQTLPEREESNFKKPRVRKASAEEKEIIQRNLAVSKKEAAIRDAEEERRLELKAKKGTDAVLDEDGVDISDKIKKHKKKTKVFIEDEDEEDKFSDIVSQYDEEKKTVSKVVRQRASRRDEPKKEEKKHTFNPRQKDYKISGAVTVGDLSNLLGIKAPQIIKSLMSLGIMASINQPIDPETAQLVATENGIDLKVETKSLEDDIQHDDKEENMTLRPPVITIMGHVDHGKTSLLDALRKTNVVDGESGGITQHIGAYLVKTSHGNISFMDTPGHAAFSSMRARGANTTDIVIIVVAADDGPMPQTVEAINHAKAAEVPIIVAINKCDKPDSNPNKVMTQLMEHGLISEDMGGDTIMVNVSAKSREGLDKLLEMIALQAEIMELRADPKRPAEGAVIESRVDKGKGNVATVLIQKGTLKVGDNFIAGTEFGRVKRLMDDKGKVVKQATPSTPIELIGFNGLPNAGDNFVVVSDEKLARQISEERSQQEKENAQAAKKKDTLQDFFNSSDSPSSELNLIIKADVKGSQEALNDSLVKQGNEEVSVKIIHSDVGAITMSDITLASASKAYVIGFNVRPETNAKKLAEDEGVDIRTYSVIYDAINDVKQALEGLLEPVVREQVQGNAEIREVFSIPKIGMIAGCYIKEGFVTRNSELRILRDNVVIHEGKIGSLKRFKDDVKEVKHGYECGIGIENFKDVQVGDYFEFFVHVEEKAKL